MDYLYFFLLIGVLTLPAGALLAVTLLYKKSGKELCKIETASFEAVSKLRYDDTNVIKQNSNLFLLAAVMLILIVVLISLMTATGGLETFGLASFLFYGTVGIASEFLLFYYFNFGIFLYNDFFVYRNVFGKALVSDYETVEIRKANRLVTAHFANKRVTIQFDCINVEKFLLKCGIPASTFKNYNSRERYRVNKVNPEELLSKKNKKKGKADVPHTVSETPFDEAVTKVSETGQEASQTKIPPSDDDCP